MTWLLAVWATTIAIWDYCERRIPNWLLLAGALAGLGFLATQGHGVVGAGWAGSLVGAVLGAAFWLPGYLLKKLGAGDVKLAACIGGLLGGVAAVEAMLVAGVVLGVMSVLASLSFSPTRRLPAAVALTAGFVTRLFTGPLITA